MRWYLKLADYYLLLPLLPFFCGFSAAECIPASDARRDVGEEQCIIGKVVHVKHGSGGVTMLEFCQDSMVCPFTVVTFHHDLKNVGDVNELQGRVIEVHGMLKEYNGRAEIVLQRTGQLTGDAARIPTLPKNFDVEKHGRFSAGTFSLPKPAYKTSKKRQTTKLPTNIPEDTGSEGETGIPR